MTCHIINYPVLQEDSSSVSHLDASFLLFITQKIYPELPMNDQGTGISASPRVMMKMGVITQADVHFVRVVCSGSVGPCSELQTTSLHSGPFL